MRSLVIAALVTLMALPAYAAGQSKAEALKPVTEDQKTFYAVGLIMARQASGFELTAEELDYVKQGLTDGVTGATPQVELEGYKNKIQQMAVARRDAQGTKLAAQSREFLDKAAKENGAVKTASGMVYLPLKEGTGSSPKPTDQVKVNYRGTFIDGKEFDSSYLVGQPATLKLNQVIPCWTEGIPMMKVGGKAKLFCPSDIAYGAGGSGPIPPNATLVFEVELLDVLK